MIYTTHRVAKGILHYLAIHPPHEHETWPIIISIRNHQLQYDIPLDSYIAKQLLATS